MARGGARVGAGRPSKRTGRPTFAVIDGQKTPTSVIESGVSAIPPEDLPTDQRDFWHRYAPQAIEARTLTIRTVAAFRLLCELDAEKTATKQVIDRDGRTYVKAFCDSSGQEHQELKAHPLTSAYRQLSQRVEALMARFGLAPLGKPVDSGPKKAAVNPWAKVVAK